MEADSKKESANMEFRWVAVIAVWSNLSGPIFNGKVSWSTPSRERASANSVKSAAGSKSPGTKLEVTSRH
jgi:hypothetical protein